MLPGVEIPSTIKFEPYQNAMPYAEYIITNTEPNNIANIKYFFMANFRPSSIASSYL